MAAIVEAIDAGHLDAEIGLVLSNRETAAGLAFARERGLEAVTDTGLLENAVSEVMKQHAEDVERVRGGEQKVLNFLMGQVMKRTGGKADPAAVRALLAKRIDEGADS